MFCLDFYHHTLITYCLQKKKTEYYLNGYINYASETYDVTIIFYYDKTSRVLLKAFK